MGAVLKMSRPSLARLECSDCGAQADAACNCGSPYVPARARAAEAIAANPEKSDRAIAVDLGIGKDTVRRARDAGGAHAPPEKRVGLDGKHYPIRVHTDPEPSMEEDLDNNPATYRAAFLLRVDTARRCAVYSGPVTAELIAAARAVAAKWNRLVEQMEGTNG